MSNGPAIVIDVTREDWPGGPRTLTRLDPHREPNWLTFWFGAELAPAGNQVWFRITGEAIERMQEETPGARGNRLVDALLAWLSDDRDHQLRISTASRSTSRMPVIRGSNPTVADSLAAIVSAETTIGRPSPTTRRLVDASVSDNTRRAYAGALGQLDAWLDGRQLDNAALAAYLAELHDAGDADGFWSPSAAARRTRRARPAMCVT